MNAKTLLIIRAYAYLQISAVYYAITISSFTELLITYACMFIIWIVIFYERYMWIEKREKHLRRMGT